MKNAIVSLLLLLMVTQYVTAQKKVIKIACIGNSITYGVGTRTPAKDSYPAVLGQRPFHWDAHDRQSTLSYLSAEYADRLLSIDI